MLTGHCAVHLHPACKPHTTDLTLGADFCRQEVLSLHSAGGTHKNATHLIGPAQSRQLLEKAHIHEAEVTFDAATAEACPTLAVWDASAAMRTMLSILWPQGSGSVTLDSQATKLQYNSGAALQPWPRMAKDSCGPLGLAV